MRTLRILFAKELNATLTSPIGYTVAAVFLLVLGYTFSLTLFATKVANLQYIFHQMYVLSILLVPVLTMRTFAEERRSEARAGHARALRTRARNQRQSRASRIISSSRFRARLSRVEQAVVLIPSTRDTVGPSSSSRTRARLEWASNDRGSTCRARRMSRSARAKSRNCPASTPNICKASNCLPSLERMKL